MSCASASALRLAAFVTHKQKGNFYYISSFWLFYFFVVFFFFVSCKLFKLDWFKPICFSVCMCSFSHLRMYSGQMRFVKEIFTYSLVYNFVCYVFAGDNTCNIMLFSFFVVAVGFFSLAIGIYICVYGLDYVWPERQVNVVVIAIHSHIQPTNSCNHQQSADLFNVDIFMMLMY